MALLNVTALFRNSCYCHSEKTLISAVSQRLQQLKSVELLSYKNFAVLCIFVLLWLSTPIAIEVVSEEVTKLSLNCTCDDGEKMCFEIDGKSGKQFDCALARHLQRFRLTDAAIRATEDSFLNEFNFVVVMYASSNHFKESRMAIRDFRSKFKNKIIYYNLGLLKAEVAELKNVCNLELRSFNFSNYPLHVRNLQTYAFKAIIEAEMRLQYANFYIIDSSVSLANETCVKSQFQKINNQLAPNFLLGQNVGEINEFTHPGMYVYFPMPVKWQTRNAQEAVTLHRRSKYEAEVMKWLLLCSLVKECIAPTGATLSCSPLCHRFDQSARNLIVTGLLDPNSNLLSASHECVAVKRGRESKEKLLIPC